MAPASCLAGRPARRRLTPDRTLRRVSELDASPTEPVLEWDTPCSAWRAPSTSRRCPTRTSRTWSPSGSASPSARSSSASRFAATTARCEIFPGYRVQHSTAARPDEGRHALRPRGLARRVRRARDLDDVEVRAPAAPVRRREGRHPLRPAGALAARAREAHAPLHVGADPRDRPAHRHPGARHGHERADDGLDDGHVLDADRLRRAGGRHRQADLDRRLRLPARGDRRRRRDGHRAGRAAARLRARRAARASCRASATSAVSPRRSCTSAAPA